MATVQMFLSHIPQRLSEARVRQRSLPSKAVPSTSGSRPRWRVIPSPTHPHRLSAATRFPVKREDDARLACFSPIARGLYNSNFTQRR